MVWLSSLAVEEESALGFLSVFFLLCFLFLFFFLFGARLPVGMVVSLLATVDAAEWTEEEVGV